MKHSRYRFKRLLSFVLALTMLVSLFAGYTLAWDSDSDNTGSMTNSAKAAAKSYRSWSTLDPAWKDLNMGAGDDTIGKEGSAVVSVTKLIIQADIADETTCDVAIMTNYLNANGGFTVNGGLYWGAPGLFVKNTYGKDFNNSGRLLGDGDYKVSDYTAKILEWVKAGFHLVIAVDSYHWIAVDEGRTLAEDQVYIMDCLPDTTKNVNVLLADTYTRLRAVQAYKGGTTHGHTYTSAVVPAKCDSDGYTDHVCSDCGESYADNFITKLGHTFDAGTITTAPTCTEAGVKTFTCVRCPETKTEPVEATGHKYTETVVPPTCTENGYTQHFCSECTHTYNDNFVTKLDHDFDAVVTKPTATTAGYTTYTCKRCPYSYKSNFIDPHEHTYGAWKIEIPSSATETGTRYRICTLCPERDEQVIPWYCPFTDVDPAAFYYIPVLWAAGRTPVLTTGITDTTFCPNDACTRAQVVTFLWRAAGSPEPSIMTTPFTDLVETAYYYKAVLWAVENGITNGTSATTFSPNVCVTRAEFVTFLWRYAGSPTASISEVPFVDLDSTRFYYNAVIWALKTGVTSGMDATHFNPEGYCRRGQVVTFLYRYIGE